MKQFESIIYLSLDCFVPGPTDYLFRTTKLETNEGCLSHFCENYIIILLRSVSFMFCLQGWHSSKHRMVLCTLYFVHMITMNLNLMISQEHQRGYFFIFSRSYNCHWRMNRLDFDGQRSRSLSHTPQSDAPGMTGRNFVILLYTLLVGPNKKSDSF